MRLVSTIRTDLRLQWRNGFYLAAAAVLVSTILVLRWIPEEGARAIMPAALISNIVTNTFYFAAAQVLLEHGEGTRIATAITPLRTGEYLTSKVITLAGLSLIETLSISVLGIGGDVLEPIALASLALGVAMASILLTLAGIGFAAGYRSVNEAMMPSVLVVMIASIPVFGWYGLGGPLLHAAHPIAGPLWLIGQWAQPMTPWMWAAAFVVPALWFWPVYRFSAKRLAGSTHR